MKIISAEIRYHTSHSFIVSPVVKLVYDQENNYVEISDGHTWHNMPMEIIKEIKIVSESET